MIHSRQQIMQQISDLFASQRTAVLSTQKDNQPYASLVAFTVSDDLNHFYFLTPRATRKYDYLTANPKVAVLVNDSKNQAEDIYNAVSVTGTGVAFVVEKTEEKNALLTFLKKHPHLEEFSNEPTTAFVRITMKQYVMVNAFQNVVEFTVTSELPFSHMP